MTYRLFIEKAAQKALAEIPQPYQGQIISSIEQLAEAPRPHGARKLTGRDAWRVRVGDYRILYEIHDDQLVILVIRVGHRREIYRR